MIAVVFSTTAWAENFFCSVGTGPTPAGYFRLDYSDDGGSDFSVFCRSAVRPAATGEFLLSVGDIPPAVTIKPEEWELKNFNEEVITASVSYSTNEVRVDTSFLCCKGVAHWQLQLICVLPENTLEAGKKYKGIFTYAQHNIGKYDNQGQWMGGPVFEGQQDLPPNSSLGIWEYLIGDAETPKEYVTQIFMVEPCDGPQRIDFGLAGNSEGVDEGWFKIVGDVVFEEVSE